MPDEETPSQGAAGDAAPGSSSSPGDSQTGGEKDRTSQAGGPSGEDVLLDAIRQRAGEDIARQFSSGDKALESLVHARELVGRRNEKADAYDALMKVVGGDEKRLYQALEQALAQPATDSRGRKATEPNRGGSPPQPADFEDFDDYLDAVARGRDEEGNVTDRRVGRINKEMQRAAFELARDPKGFLERHAGELLDGVRDDLTREAREAAARSVAADKQTREWEKLEVQFKDDLFVGGDLVAREPTPLGRKVQKEVLALQEDLGTEEFTPGMLRRAVEAVKGREAQPPRTRQVDSRAKRKPNSSAAPETMTPKKFFAGLREKGVPEGTYLRRWTEWQAEHGAE